MNTTLAEKLNHHPDILAAKRQILDTLESLQSDITGPSRADPSRSLHYETLIEKFQSQRGGPLIFPYIGTGFGKGPLVELEDGSIKYDFICGIGVYQFGHCNPMLVEAGLDAALKDTIIQGHLQQNKDSLELTDTILRLANRTQQVFDHCFLTSSGVMAGENALKITFQKKFPANRVFAFKRCFAGRTLAFSQINDKAVGRAGLPDCFPVDHLPFFEPNDPEGSTKATLHAMQSLIEAYPGKHAALMVELVQGEGGFYPGDTDYFRKVMELCRSHGIAVLVDEIQTFSRLSEPFAYQYYGLEDLVDVAWIGKASQVCATLFKKDFAPKPGLLGQTYTAATSVIESATRILKALENEHFFGDDGKIERLSRYTIEKLEQFASETGWISGPFGLGSMVCFTPFEGETKRTMALVQALFQNGVITLTAGSHPTKCRFLLPYPVIEESDIDAVLAITFDTIRTMASEAK
jgi:4-aminobutyrate aminotransferase-like enzyme